MAPCEFIVAAVGRVAVTILLEKCPFNRPPPPKCNPPKLLFMF